MCIDPSWLPTIKAIVGIVVFDVVWLWGLMAFADYRARKKAEK